MKILVTGNAGAGKSTLGRKVADQLDIPFYTLDKIFWQPGWQKTPHDEKRQKLATITTTKHWVIDGVSPDVEAIADIIIFLDMPRRVCLVRALNRSRKYLFTSRPDLPPGCPEIRIIPTLVKIIWRFPKRVRPRLLAHGRSKTTTFVHLKAAPQNIETFITEQLV